VSINVNIATNVLLNLYDAKGALVKTVRANLPAGINQLQLNTTGLASGIYNLTARWNNQIQVIKMVKE